MFRFSRLSRGRGRREVVYSLLVFAGVEISSADLR